MTNRSTPKGVTEKPCFFLKDNNRIKPTEKITLSQLIQLPRIGQLSGPQDNLT